MVNKVEHLVAKEPDFFSGGNEYADNVIMIITFTRSPTPKNKWMHELNVFLWKFLHTSTDLFILSDYTSAQEVVENYAGNDMKSPNYVLTRMTKL